MVMYSTSEGDVSIVELYIFRNKCEQATQKKPFPIPIVFQRQRLGYLYSFSDVMRKTGRIATPVLRHWRGNDKQGDSRASFARPAHNSPLSRALYRLCADAPRMLHAYIIIVVHFPLHGKLLLLGFPNRKGLLVSRAFNLQGTESN